MPLKPEQLQSFQEIQNSQGPPSFNADLFQELFDKREQLPESLKPYEIVLYSTLPYLKEHPELVDQIKQAGIPTDEMEKHPAFAALPFHLRSLICRSLTPLPWEEIQEQDLPHIQKVLSSFQELSDKLPDLIKSLVEKHSSNDQLELNVFIDLKPTITSFADDVGYDFIALDGSLSNLLTARWAEQLVIEMVDQCIRICVSQKSLDNNTVRRLFERIKPEPLRKFILDIDAIWTAPAANLKVKLGTGGRIDQDGFVHGPHHSLKPMTLKRYTQVVPDLHSRLELASLMERTEERTGNPGVDDKLHTLFSEDKKGLNAESSIMMYLSKEALVSLSDYKKELGDSSELSTREAEKFQLIERLEKEVSYIKVKYSFLSILKSGELNPGKVVEFYSQLDGDPELQQKLLDDPLISNPLIIQGIIDRVTFSARFDTLSEEWLKVAAIFSQSKADSTVKLVRRIEDWSRERCVSGMELIKSQTLRLVKEAVISEEDISDGDQLVRVWQRVFTILSDEIIPDRTDVLITDWEAFSQWQWCDDSALRFNMAFYIESMDREDDWKKTISSMALSFDEETIKEIFFQVRKELDLQRVEAAVEEIKSKSEYEELKTILLNSLAVRSLTEDSQIDRPEGGLTLVNQSDLQRAVSNAEKYLDQVLFKIAFKANRLLDQLGGFEKFAFAIRQGYSSNNDTVPDYIEDRLKTMQLMIAELGEAQKYLDNKFQQVLQRVVSMELSSLALDNGFRVTEIDGSWLANNTEKLKIQIQGEYFRRFEKIMPEVNELIMNAISNIVSDNEDQICRAARSYYLVTYRDRVGNNIELNEFVKICDLMQGQKLDPEIIRPNAALWTIRGEVIPPDLSSQVANIMTMEAQELEDFKGKVADLELQYASLNDYILVLRQQEQQRTQGLSLLHPVRKIISQLDEIESIKSYISKRGLLLRAEAEDEYRLTVFARERIRETALLELKQIAKGVFNEQKALLDEKRTKLIEQISNLPTQLRNIFDSDLHAWIQSQLNLTVPISEDLSLLIYDNFLIYLRDSNTASFLESLVNSISQGKISLSEVLSGNLSPLEKLVSDVVVNQQDSQDNLKQNILKQIIELLEIAGLKEVPSSNALSMIEALLMKIGGTPRSYAAFVEEEIDEVRISEIIQAKEFSKLRSMKF